MDYRLAELQQLAFDSPEIRDKFISTLKEAEPLSAFCDLAASLGYFITPGELSILGEESCAAMLRSQNGGGEIEPGGWNDDFELFFLNIGAIK